MITLVFLSPTFNAVQVTIPTDQAADRITSLSAQGWELIGELEDGS